jgi:ribonuclease HII
MPIKPFVPLARIYDPSNNFEIGIDECARGPLFGRLYVAATILPKNEDFKHDEMKDSKKIKSRKKMRELSDYIKEYAVAWHIHFIEADVIDDINIRQAVLRGMKECIKQVLNKVDATAKNTFIVIDGNDFTGYTVFDNETQTIREVPHTTVEQGDGKYTFIAAASILAKNAHDEYILDLCEEHPALIERYSLDTNVGYGTKKHIDGIEKHGISQWHRKTYARCKEAKYSPL